MLESNELHLLEDTLPLKRPISSCQHHKGGGKKGPFSRPLLLRGPENIFWRLQKWRLLQPPQLVQLATVPCCPGCSYPFRKLLTFGVRGARVSCFSPSLLEFENVCPVSSHNVRIHLQPLLSSQKMQWCHFTICSPPRIVTLFVQKYSYSELYLTWSLIVWKFKTFMVFVKKKTVSRIRFSESICKNKDVLGLGYALTDGNCCICLFNCWFFALGAFQHCCILLNWITSFNIMYSL